MSQRVWSMVFVKLHSVYRPLLSLRTDQELPNVRIEIRAGETSACDIFFPCIAAASSSKTVLFHLRIQAQ